MFAPAAADWWSSVVMEEIAEEGDVVLMAGRKSKLTLEREKGNVKAGVVFRMCDNPLAPGSANESQLWQSARLAWPSTEDGASSLSQRAGIRE